MPVVISGGGAVATVADTPQIDLGLTNAQLTADVVAGSIGSTQLSSAVNSALTLAGTAVQPAALTSYLPLSGGALTGAVTSTSTITTRQSANTVQSLVVSGTTQTIDWNNGGSINLDLSSASGNVTLTLQNPVSGAVYRMRVQQGATVRNLTFPAGTVQQGGGGNVYTGIAGVDFLTVYYNGSDYLVQSALNSGFVQPTNNAIFTGVTQAAALRLNGTAVIASTTAPAIRTDGTALVAGDLWYNPSAGIWGFWQSPYWLGSKESLIVACTGASQPITTGTAKETFRAAQAFLLTEVRASLTTAATGSTVIVDINLNGVSVLGVKISIDATEKTSVTAASAATITTAFIPSDGEITIDIDQVGATIPGAGLKVILLGFCVL